MVVMLLYVMFRLVTTVNLALEKADCVVPEDLVSFQASELVLSQPVYSLSSSTMLLQR